MGEPKPKDGMDIAALYKRYGPLVLRRGRRFLGDSEAEEIVHEVFLRAIEHAHEFRGEASPSTWLFRVTTHLCLNRLRDRRRQGELLTQHGPTVWAQTDSGQGPEAHALLNQLWRSLSEELVMIGIYYYIDGLTTAEIGRILGVSDRTIANRLKDIAKHAEGVGDAA